MKVRDAVKRTIASNIKRARIESKMTQAEAADKLGITAQAISNYERGINGIENSLLLRMCEIYNTNMRTILGEEIEEKENAPDQLVLTEDEMRILTAFREMSPERQKALADLLGISDPQK